MAEDLRQRIAEAAETAHKAWVGKRYDDERTYGDFIGNAVSAVRDEELEQLREEHATQADSIRSYQADIRDRWIPMEQELERLRQVIDRHDYGLMPVCEGYMASRAEHAEAAIARARRLAEEWAELAEPGDESAASLDRAVADSGRDLLAALDDSQETDRG